MKNLIVAVFIFTVVSIQAKGENVKMAPKLIALIQDAQSQFPFKDLVAADKLLKTKFEQKSDNGSFTSYESSSAQPQIKSAELRANFKNTPAKQILIVKLNEAVALTNGDLESALKAKETPMGATTSHMTLPETYSVFQLSKMQVRITYNLKKEVTGFVLDSFEPKKDEDLDRIAVKILLGREIHFDLISKYFKFSQFKKKKGLEQFKPVYSGAIGSLLLGQSCKIYIGEFAKHTGVYMKNPPLESRFVEFKLLGKPVTNLDEAKKYISTLEGYSDSFESEIVTNKNGIKLATANFDWVGGKSYSYAIIMGEKAILISESRLVDLESITF